MLPLLAILLITQQGAFFANSGGDRIVDHVKVSAWLVMSAVILLALLTGGGWIYPKRVRNLANDEATQVNRLKAIRTGFVAAMVPAWRSISSPSSSRSRCAKPFTSSRQLG